MKVKCLSIALIAFSSFVSSSLAQPNCYDEYTGRFKTNGANPVPDGMQRVIIGIKDANGNESCAEGQIQVSGGKYVPPVYLLHENGTYSARTALLDHDWYRQAETSIDRSIEQGMSAVHMLLYDRRARLFFIDYLKPDPGNIVEARTEGNLYPGKKVEETHMNRINVSARSIQFETGKATLTKSSLPVLDAIAEVMLLYPENKWAIDGHTDNTGTAEFNRMLSHERAQAVAVYLYNKGIKPTNLYVNGYGEDIPIADNATADGRKQNRRVEIEPIQ